MTLHLHVHGTAPPPPKHPAKWTPPVAFEGVRLWRAQRKADRIETFVRLDWPKSNEQGAAVQARLRGN